MHRVSRVVSRVAVVAGGELPTRPVRTPSSTGGRTRPCTMPCIGSRVPSSPSSSTSTPAA
jgi:hypothetical protein